MKPDDNLPLMTWHARPDMSCEYVNRAWLDFTGYTLEEALGEGWSRRLHPEDLARWLDAGVRAFDARRPFEIEYRLRRRDGEYRWVRDCAAPRITADGFFVGYAGACIDIDDQKREQQGLARALERERRLRVSTEEASRARHGLTVSVLQELQSPAQAIATWAGQLREQVAQASEAAHALEAIERSARTQSRIISNLLELTAAAAGGMSFAPEPVLPQEALMNWDRIQGNWKQMKGKLKEKWGKLTDDEFDQLAGNRDQLVGKIQERYGCAKDEAERQVKDWESRNL